MTAMIPYLAIVGARFRTLLQYRGAALAGCWTQLLFGLVRIMVLEAFYRSSSTPQSFTFAEAVGYIWLGQVTFTMLPYNLDRDVRDQVKTGTLAYELVRPVDLFFFWYSRALAWRTAPMLLRSLPMVVLAAWVLPAIGLPEWGLGAPVGLAAGLMWALTMVGAVAVSAALTSLMSVSLVRTISGEGIVLLLTSIVSLLSGMVIPLPLFPDWAQPVLSVLPFAALVDLPARIYTGDIPPSAGAWVVLHQLFWTLALIGLGRWLLGRSIRRLVIQGG